MFIFMSEVQPDQPQSRTKRGLSCVTQGMTSCEKKEFSVDFKKVRIKKYQVEEFSYFFLRLKELKASYLSSESRMILSQMRELNILKLSTEHIVKHAHIC